MRNVIILMLAISAVAACASAGGMKQDPLEEGHARVYGASFDETLQAARDAVVEAGLKFDSADEIENGTWMIIAKTSTSFWSWGELVRVVVSAEDSSRTRVNVLTKRRAAINVTAKGDYSDTILSNIELKLQ